MHVPHAMVAVCMRIDIGVPLDHLACLFHAASIRRWSWPNVPDMKRLHHLQCPALTPLCTFGCSESSAGWLSWLSSYVGRVGPSTSPSMRPLTGLELEELQRLVPLDSSATHEDTDSSSLELSGGLLVSLGSLRVACMITSWGTPSLQIAVK